MDMTVLESRDVFLVWADNCLDNGWEVWIWINTLKGPTWGKT